MPFKQPQVFLLIDQLVFSYLLIDFGIVPIIASLTSAVYIPVEELTQSCNQIQIEDYNELFVLDDFQTRYLKLE